MTVQTRDTLKAFFESGDRPNQSQFGDLIDTFATGPELTAGLNTRAASDHAHAIANVTGLQAALDAKAATTALEAVPVMTETGAAYLLGSGTAGKVVRRETAEASTTTIPADTTHTHPVGTVIFVRQSGGGSTTVSAVAEVTLNGIAGGSTSTDALYAELVLQKVGANAWECPNVEVLS